MEFVDLFNGISLGTVIAWILAFIFLSGLIMSGLNRYYKFKKDFEERNKKLEKHDAQIDKIDQDVKEIDKKVDAILVSLDEVMENADQREARRLRREILKFSDNIRNGKSFSIDAFQDIIESNEEYERIIKKRNINNGFTEREMAFIVKKYDELYGGV